MRCGVAPRKRGLQNLQGIAVRYQQEGLVNVAPFQVGNQLGNTRHHSIGAFHRAVLVVRVLGVVSPDLGVSVIGVVPPELSESRISATAGRLM